MKAILAWSLLSLGLAVQVLYRRAPNVHSEEPQRLQLSLDGCHSEGWLLTEPLGLSFVDQAKSAEVVSEEARDEAVTVVSLNVGFDIADGAASPHESAASSSSSLTPVPRPHRGRPEKPWGESGII